MLTSALLFALSGFGAAAADEGGITWQTDYVQARKLAIEQQKPLVVVLGTGQAGWQKLSPEGFDPAMRQYLANSYVAVYVNSETEEGKRLAEAFGMASGFGIVISDRTGRLQAFWHEGDLTQRALLAYLQEFSDPNLVVSTTVINPGRDGHKKHGGGGDCYGGACGVGGGYAGGACGAGGCYTGGYASCGSCSSSSGDCHSGCGKGRRGGGGRKCR